MKILLILLLIFVICGCVNVPHKKTDAKELIDEWTKMDGSARILE